MTEEAEMRGGGHPPHEAIAQRAYEIWLEEGSPNGWDLRHWFQAKAELLEEELQAEAAMATPERGRATVEPMIASSRQSGMISKT
jgi:hypothetical protein